MHLTCSCRSNADAILALLSRGQAYKVQEFASDDKIRTFWHDMAARVKAVCKESHVDMIRPDCGLLLNLRRPPLFTVMLPEE